jgi:hypothetical protein
MIDLPAQVTLERALRVVGQDLEARGVTYAEVTIGLTGIVVETTGPYVRQEYPWGNLGIRLRSALAPDAAEAAPWLDLLALTRWPVLLGLLGEFLDHRGRLRTSRIEAELAPVDKPTACQVRVTAADDVVLDTDGLQEYLLRLRARAAPLPEASPGVGEKRPWWAFWQAR